MSKKSSKLPPEVIDHWPEVFEDIEVNVVPLEYLHSIRVTFSDGNIWVIDIDKSRRKVKHLEKSLEELFKEYQENIQNVDFRLDTEKVKKDVMNRTQKFLKFRR